MTIEEIARDDHPADRLDEPARLQAAADDDPKVRQPDITRARTLLGWEPKVALEEGLTKTLAYFRRARSERDEAQPRPRLRQACGRSVPELDDLQARSGALRPRVIASDA